MSLIVVVLRMREGKVVVGRKEVRRRDVVRRIAVMGRDAVEVRGMGRKTKIRIRRVVIMVMERRESKEVGMRLVVVEVVGTRRITIGQTLTPMAMAMKEEKRCGTMTLRSLESNPTTIIITATKATKTKITEMAIKMGERRGVDTVDSARTISGAERTSRSWSFWRPNMRRINGSICKLGFIIGGDAWLMRV
jgi:hypothetical protein